MPDSTFDTARRHFMEGVAHHEAGRHAEAEAAFLASLALVPGRPSSLMNLGVAQLAQGRASDALDNLDQAIAADPANAQARCHRAAACEALGQPEQALAEYTEALRLEPGLSAARWHGALLLARQQRADQALDWLQALLDPGQPAAAPAWRLAGQCLQSLERHDEAVPHYRRALALDLALPRAHALLGQALQRLGQPQAAAEVHRQAIAAGVDAPLNRYLLAGLQGAEAPPRSPDDYVRGLFDHYAADFDQHLVGTLHYLGHELVAEAAALALGPSGRARFAHVLDLGCGTGLCGRRLAGLADRITRVDLSPTMVEQSRRSGAYAEVVEAEVGAYLATSRESFDLVVAADLFIYIGALEALLDALAPRLRPGAWLVCTLETVDDAAGAPADSPGWRLQPSLRYAHTRGYIERLAARHGLHLRRWQPAVIRHEQGEPIQGAVASLESGAPSPAGTSG